jgi:aquaporin Z
MATKKTASSTRKMVKKPAPSVNKTSTKVTTVKAVPTAATARAPRFKFSRAPLLASSVAEFIGTFLLAGVILVASGQPLFVLFAVLAIVLTIGGVSGAHLNPVLTLGALATRRITLIRAVCYIIAQVLGALMALVIMNAFVNAAPEVSEQAQAFGQTAPTLFSAPEIEGGKEWTVLTAELLGSVVLAFGVATALRNRKGSVAHAFTYAGTVYVAAMIAGTAANYVGASAVLNPAVAGSLQAIKFELWPILVYVVTPLVGGVLGFALNDLLRSESEATV